MRKSFFSMIISDKNIKKKKRERKNEQKLSSRLSAEEPSFGLFNTCHMCIHEFSLHNIAFGMTHDGSHWHMASVINFR